MTDQTPLTDEELAAMESQPCQFDRCYCRDAARLIADLRACRAVLRAKSAMIDGLEAEVERMADALWAICDGADASPQDRIIVAGGLGDRYDHSKPLGR